MRDFLGLNESESIRRILNEHPLLLFELYASTQARSIEWLGKRVIHSLDVSIQEGSGGSCSVGVEHIDAYHGFWFFILGAYELVRTLRQEKRRFCNCFSEKIDCEYIYLKKIRIPFAKLELQNNGGPVSSELSMTGFKTNPSDCLFRIEGEQYSMRHCIQRMEAFISGVEWQHVLSQLPTRKMRSDNAP